MYSEYIEYTDSMEMGMRADIPPNQVSFILHTSGRIINVNTMKDET